MAAALLFAALGARAEMPLMLDVKGNALDRQIISKAATEKNGGVTGVVGVAGTRQGIGLEFAEAAPFAAHMAPAASPSNLALKPAPGLAPKKVKARKKAKKARRSAAVQLKQVFQTKDWR